MSGYSALREGAAWIDLNGRGRIRVLGEDRARLLHAMSTNHVQALTPGQGCYAFFLNAQGRILSDAAVLCFDDAILLDTEPESHDPLFQHIDRYIIADDVTLEDARPELSVIGIEGPASAQVLERLGMPVPEAEYAHAPWEGAWIAKISSTGQPGYRIYVPALMHPTVINRLVSAGIPAASAVDQRTVRLEQHQPRYGEDITDRYLVHETRQLRAVHFNKGCYLGQEIVERVRSRGQVHRLLTALTISAPEILPAGTPLKAGETAAGEITSSAFSPALGKVVALAYVRSEHAKPGTVLSAGQYTAEVVE